MVAAVLAVLVAGCGDGSSDVAAGDAPAEPDTQDDAADPVEEDPGNDPSDHDAAHDANETDDTDAAGEPHEADEPDRDGSDQAASDPDDVDVSSVGEGTEADDPTVDKVVELPHVWHNGGGAAISGTLRADPDMDGGCFWLADANRDGHPSGLAALFSQRDGERLEEPHFWARFYDDGSPAELIFDEDQQGEGEVIAREGDEVEVGGGWWEIARLDVGDLRCQLDEEVALVDLYDLDVVNGS